MGQCNSDSLLALLVLLTDTLDLPCAWLLAWLANTDGTVDLYKNSAVRMDHAVATTWYHHHLMDDITEQN